METSEQNREENYETLVKQYSSALYRYAYRLSGRHDASEELVQETFFEAWKTIRKQSVEYPQAMLFKILNRRFSRWIETREKMPATPLENAVETDFPEVQCEIETVAQKDLVQVAIGKLDENTRRVVLLVLMEGLTCDQASEVLSIPKGTVLSRLHRGKEKLKQVLVRLSNMDSNQVTNQ